MPVMQWIAVIFLSISEKYFFLRGSGMDDFVISNLLVRNFKDVVESKLKWCDC